MASATATYVNEATNRNYADGLSYFLFLGIDVD